MAKSISLAKQSQRIGARRAAKRRGLFAHRYPNFEAAIARERIEVLVVALETGRVGGFQFRCRQPVIPDRVDGAANGRDVLAVREHRVALFGNPHRRKFPRQVGEIRDFDAGDVVEVSGIIAIAADAVGYFPDPAWNVVDQLAKTLPLPGNAGAVLAGPEPPRPATGPCRIPRLRSGPRA